MSRLSRAVASVVISALAFVPPASGQVSDSGSARSDYPTNSGAAATPFGPGEVMVYKVKVGWKTAGEGRIRIEALDTVRGHETYRSVMTLDAGFIGLNVDDSYTSWFDVRTLQSWRYVADIHEPFYSAFRHFEFYPDRRRWEREDNQESGRLGSSLPLDEVSFIYFIRTLPLEVGKTYTHHRFFKEDGNPVKIEVLRKETREVEGVTYNTIVVRPIIRTKGLFSEGGEAELHFTDDERRLLVYMKTDLPNFPGSLTLHLKSVEVGLPLNPDARARAIAGREARGGQQTPGR